MKLKEVFRIHFKMIDLALILLAIIIIVVGGVPQF